jgi:hypothetical protein
MAQHNGFLFEAPVGEAADAMAHRTLKGGKKNKDPHDRGRTRDTNQRNAKAQRDAATSAQIRASHKQQTLADILRRIKLSNLRLDQQQHNDEQLRRIRERLAEKQRGFNLDVTLQGAGITPDELISFLKQHGIIADYLFEVPINAEIDSMAIRRRRSPRFTCRLCGTLFNNASPICVDCRTKASGGPEQLRACDRCSRWTKEGLLSIDGLCPRCAEREFLREDPPDTPRSPASYPAGVPTPQVTPSEVTTQPRPSIPPTQRPASPPEDLGGFLIGGLRPRRVVPSRRPSMDDTLSSTLRSPTGSDAPPATLRSPVGRNAVPRTFRSRQARPQLTKRNRNLPWSARTRHRKYR